MDIYTEIILFWFNNKNNWFGCSNDFDTIINNKYKTLLETHLNEEIIVIVDKNVLLGKIILLDQFSRHIYRNDENKKEIIKQYDDIALQILEQYNVDDEIFINQFSPEERCFLMMPFRHTFDEKYLLKCIELINEWTKISKDNNSFYKRFYQATLKALSDINNKKDLTYKNDIKQNIETKDIYEILDENSIYELDKIININTNDKIYIEFVNNLKLLDLSNNKKIFVSVSGGVDSMICLYLLYMYKLYNPSKNIEIGAISINYNNRVEQKIELFMVGEFCKFFNIDYYVREITEITRKRNHEREIYETITREIRFETYKRFNCHIILGHNQDDCVENIFTNLINKTKYNNLFGMEIKSQEKNVSTLRPILHISKHDIFDCAHKYFIPYVYDSTCKWSSRSKMREKLIPDINNFNRDIIPNLITFVKNFNEIYKIYGEMLPNIEYYDNYCVIDNKKNILFFDYIKQIFNIICKKYNVKYIKNKALEYLIECLKNDFRNRITLSINIVAQKCNDVIKVFIIK